jgi:hypothetical protein
MGVSKICHDAGLTNGRAEQRRHRRERTDVAVELIWKEDSYRRFECGRTVDTSPTGVGVASPQPIDISSWVILRAPGLGIVALSRVRTCVWSRTQYRLGLEFMEKAAAQPPDVAVEPDHHALLRAGVAGDAQGLDRLYRALAFRYHPDNLESGNVEIFLMIKEAYRILSPSKQYQEDVEIAKPLKTSGLQAELRRLKDKSHDVLGLLCQRRISDYRNVFVSPGDLESLTGMEADEVGFILWYLLEKDAVTLSESSYAISAVGIDILDSAQQPACKRTHNYNSLENEETAGA